MELNDENNKAFQPTHFVTIYRRGDNFSKGDLYMEIGPILKDGKKYRIGPSMQADKDFLNDLVASVKTDNFKALKFKGLVPENVHWFHSESQDPTIIWTNESCERQLYFSTKNVESGIYKMPRLLFACSKGQLFVFRLATDEPITMERFIFMMPLPNIYDDGQVCLGDSKRKLKKPQTMDDYIQNMESLFFNTKFNSIHHNKFGKGIVFVDKIRTKNMDDFPFIASPQKTIKKLFDEIS